jgi:hypothetical protein
MNDELERMWKEGWWSNFKVLSSHSPGGTEKYYENLHSG